MGIIYSQVAEKSRAEREGRAGRAGRVIPLDEFGNPEEGEHCYHCACTQTIVGMCKGEQRLTLAAHLFLFPPVAGGRWHARVLNK